MIVTGYQLLPSYEHLWDLAGQCVHLLGSADDLMAMGESAVASSLDPWTAFPRTPWFHGRLFGPEGELHWRAYGTAVRAAIVLDAPPDQPAWQALVQAIEACGFEDGTALDLEPQEAQVQLWRRYPYLQAEVRSYLDPSGAPTFVRYCAVTGV